MNSWLLLALLLFCFGGASPDNSSAIISFPLDWENWVASRPLLLISYLFLGTVGSNFLTDFWVISACSTSPSMYGLWLLPYELSLCQESCAGTSEATWERICLRGTLERDCGTSQCIPVRIFLLSGPSKKVCSLSPRCYPRKIERGTGFSSQPRNW